MVMAFQKCMRALAPFLWIPLSSNTLFETVTPYGPIYQELILNNPGGAQCVGGGGGASANMYVEGTVVRRIVVFESSSRAMTGAEC